MKLLKVIGKVLGIAVGTIVLSLFVLNAIIGSMTHAPIVKLMPFARVYPAPPRVSVRCQIDNYEVIDARAEARKLEQLAREITPHLKDIETDADLQAKVRQLSSILSHAYAINHKPSSSSENDQACGNPYWTSLEPVVQEMINDQGFGIFSDFPSMTVYFFGAMPAHVIFHGPEGTSVDWDHYGGGETATVWTGDKWVYVEPDKIRTSK